MWCIKLAALHFIVGKSYSLNREKTYTTNTQNAIPGVWMHQASDIYAHSGTKSIAFLQNFCTVIFQFLISNPTKCKA